MFNKDITERMVAAEENVIKLQRIDFRLNKELV